MASKYQAKQYRKYFLSIVAIILFAILIVIVFDLKPVDYLTNFINKIKIIIFRGT